MTLYHKVRAVEKVFAQLGVEIQKFQEETKLSCISGCGKCCIKPDIEACAIEFLPLAYHLRKEDKLERFYEQLLERQNDRICFLFNPFITANEPGNCIHYRYRGLICRAFGFTANFDKYGFARFITCQPIKTTYNGEIERLQENIKQGFPVPIMRNYYQKLHAIDHVLCGKTQPINQALIEAVETVLGYYSYRSKPRKKIA